MADDGHGGKIDGKLKDSLPVIPDKVVEQLEKGRDVPLEAMVSPAAFEAHMEQQERRKQPVHAEDLVAVGPRDPRIAGRTSFDGETLPAVPSMRRVIPAPFQRPSISINHHGKRWQRMRADAVREGDMVVGIGKVGTIGLINKYRKRSEITGVTGDPLVDNIAVAVGFYVGIQCGEVWHRLETDEMLRVFCEEREGAEPDATRARLV